jgi:hypothetical protein
MDFFGICVFGAACMSVINFIALMWLDTKIDELKAEIKELEREIDYARMDKR